MTIEERSNYCLDKINTIHSFGLEILQNDIDKIIEAQNIEDPKKMIEVIEGIVQEYIKNK